MGSREEILERIRRNTQEIHEYPDLNPLKQAALTFEDRIGAFVLAVKAAGGDAVTAGDASDIDSIIRREYPDAKSIVSPIDIIECKTASPEDFSRPEDLDGTDVAVVRGDFGVAENGAVWITDYGKHRALLFIAEALVIILNKNNIVDNMHQAYSRDEMSRERSFGIFISGPSKTADIEQALVFGAHGARKVTVILTIIFPAEMAKRFRSGECSLADVEIAAVIAAHLAWGRRSMIVRDCTRAMDEMMWKPYGYVMAGDYRDDDASLHRTVKWSEFASICNNLKTVYSERDSIEGLTNGEIRCRIYGRKEDLKAPDKKINMMRRWMVRDDGKVDLGLWNKSDKKALLIPLDVHVYDEATALGLTSRKQKDIVTVREITDAFREIFPDDPCKGDFSLFGYGVTHGK